MGNAIGKDGLASFDDSKLPTYTMEQVRGGLSGRAAATARPPRTRGLMDGWNGRAGDEEEEDGPPRCASTATSPAPGW